ncbi:unnamed protein product [Cunninghamella blakesleeana]
MSVHNPSSDNIHPQPIRRRKSSRAAYGEKFNEYIMRRKEQFEEEHKSISIWSSPLIVISYFIMYAYYEIRNVVFYFYRHGWHTFALINSIIITWIVCQIDGPHQEYVTLIMRQFKWYGYWIILGIASSIGLGSGLHTFLLFLGPYIAEVTIAAYDCNGTSALTRNMLTNRLECLTPSISQDNIVSLWSIYSNIIGETFFWGIGTALGELPPYFMARAVALSGGKVEELQKFEAGLKNHDHGSLKDFITYFLYTGIKRLGFFGILLFASIPNPLFDLAGITCGNFLVPFSTFFGATFVGKACIKASIQAFIVILAFSRNTLSTLLSALETSAPYIHNIISQTINDQIHKFGKHHDQEGSDQVNFFGIAWNTFISLMIGYFIITTIESVGLSFMKQQHEDEINNLKIKNKERLNQNNKSTTQQS